MSNTTYFPNAALVQSGDLFKIMELRYSHSIYDEDGYYNVKQPVSNSLELIRWYRNCEIYFGRLMAEENEGIPSNEIDYCTFKNVLENLKIDPEVFLNFGITEYSKECRRLYTELQLKDYRRLTQNKKDEAEINAFLRNIHSARDELKLLAKQPERFDCNDDHKTILKDLHSFLKQTDNAYFLAFDIEIETSRFEDNCSDRWLERATTLKLIIEEALVTIFSQHTDVLRAYIKLEDDGAYGYRFHTVTLLSSIALTEQSWLASFNESLKGLLADKTRTKNYLEAKYLKELEKIRNHRDLLEQPFSEETIERIEQEIKSDIESFQHISFKLINWNSQLRNFNPELKFQIDASFTTEDLRLLEYWGIKYLFISVKYIYFPLHNKKLHPSIKCWVKDTDVQTNAIATITPVPLVRDTRPRINGSTRQIEQPNSKVVKRNIQAVDLPQRRCTDPEDAFYNNKRDFTQAMPLASVALPEPKSKFEKQEVGKGFEIQVGVPSQDEVIHSSTPCTMQDFIDYVADEKNGVVKTKINNKQRHMWAKIFYSNTILDEVLLKFLIQFECFIDNLLHSTNPFFTVKLQHNCSPEGLSTVGVQYLVLFYNFYTQQIANKLRAINIESDYWDLVINLFEYHFVEEEHRNISQVVMHQEQIQTLNDLMKKARVLAKQYEQKIKPNLHHLKYADVKPWRKAFDQERVLMRCKFSLPYSLQGKLGITGIFNAFKTRLSGKNRQFKDVQHIVICRKKNQHETLDVLLMFDNSNGAEDQKWLSEQVKELWVKSVNAAMKKCKVQPSNSDLEKLVSFIDFIPKHESLAVKYLYIRNHKAAVEKSVISHLIPYFISQAIFLQDVSSGSTHKLSMSRYLTNLFDNQIPMKKVVPVVRNKKSKAKSDSGVS